MKLIHALFLLFCINLSFSQKPLKIEGDWCSDDLRLTLNEKYTDYDVEWYFDGHLIGYENEISLSCFDFGAGKYRAIVSKGGSSDSFDYVLGNDSTPELTYDVNFYPAAAVTIFNNAKIAGHEIKSLEWDFGNGETSVSERGQAFYKEAKTYTVRLKVKTNSGCTYVYSIQYKASII